jgi:glycolate oxidase FAD binding subunit
VSESQTESGQPTETKVDPRIECVDSINSLQEMVRQTESLLIVGNQTKPMLSIVTPPTQLVSTRSLSGIIQYEPSEFTFTALAGTTLAEIYSALAAKNQYLPFDPLLVDQGATIGGTLAAGISGPGRHRFGGVRDFVLGAQFVAGDGQLIQSGGKVVKNAAGFDIPKLLVGSCGRLAAITALTFKVFPRPVELHTYSIACEDHEQASNTIATLARGRWELDAIDYQAARRTLWIRIGGPKSVCDSIASDIGKTIADHEMVSIDAELASDQWNSLLGLHFGGPNRNGVAKVPLTLSNMKRLALWCDEQEDRLSLHASVAGAIGWLSFEEQPDDESFQKIDSYFKESNMTGLLIQGPNDRCKSFIIGDYRPSPIESAVKHAMDPPGRFPSFPG